MIRLLFGLLVSAWAAWKAIEDLLAGWTDEDTADFWRECEAAR